MRSSLPKNGKTLVHSSKGKKNKIKRITDLLVAKRLFSMGLLPGSMITLIRQGWFTGTCYVKSGMITLALRREEAAAIELE